MQELSGRTAVVTGAASGIGLALARVWAAEGMRVVVADVEAESLEAAAEELRAGGAEVLAVRTDVSDPEQVESLAERSVEAFEKVHLVCHNAGVFVGGLSWETPVADYAWTFDVNVFGVIHGIRSFTPRQLSHGEPGHVVITSSMAGLTTMPALGAYTMSKHAVLALAETLHHELAQRKSALRVSALCPEVVNTRIGEAGRNRPAHRQRAQAHRSAEAVEKALSGNTAHGLDPGVIAARTLAAVREECFYVLPPEGDMFRGACQARMDAISATADPAALAPPG